MLTLNKTDIPDFMRYIVLTLLCATSLFSFAQNRIDGSFPFQTDPAKNYSLYIPSGYDSSTPHRLMIGFHPFNTSRWDAESWCDTLIAFAEFNNLILACPDGGADGSLDDAIDSAFTSALLDSMSLWYNIDERKIYAMGFSVGGKVTYTYGLSNTHRLSGFIPIGAAINGTSGFDDVLQNADSMPFYLVHGELDSPSSRFFPARAQLIGYSAIVEDTLMPGIGHTIDFPDRNAILSRAYQWVDSVNSANISSGVFNPVVTEKIEIYPNPTDSEINFNLPSTSDFSTLIINASGEVVLQSTNENKIDVFALSAGPYFIRIEQGEKIYTQSFIRQ